MNKCLIEIGCEEIPARFVNLISQQIIELLKKSLEKRSVNYSNVESYSTPRRLAVIINNIDEFTPSKTVCRKGPFANIAIDSNGQPTKAALGFAESLGISFDALEWLTEPKGERLSYTSEVQGDNLKLCMLEWFEHDVLNKLQGIKTMRWGKPGNFVRPIQWITAKFGAESLNGKLMHVAASEYTLGHRFMSEGQVKITHANDYLANLRANFVEPDPFTRKTMIEQQIAAKTPAGCQTIVEPKLLSEVINLVEWPEVLIGSFDPEFLRLPAAALEAVLHQHQRCFIVKNANGIAPFYVMVSNIISDNPKQVIAGNNHVITARLADACFFYDQDCKVSLANHASKLSNMTYQKQLGSMLDKTNRLKKYVQLFANQLSVNPTQLTEAAELAKADLACELVNELPELQGIFGAHLASLEGLPSEVTTAIATHRMPMPETRLARALAIIDQLDHLLCFFSIGLQPTGEKDPFALRRAATNVVNCILEYDSSLTIQPIIAAMDFYSPELGQSIINLLVDRMAYWCQKQNINTSLLAASRHIAKDGNIQRLKACILAVKHEPNLDDLIATYKRLLNLTRELSPNAEIPKLSNPEPSELTLANMMHSFADSEPENEIRQLKALIAPINQMLDNVRINVPEAEIKQQRLSLILASRYLFLRVADFSLISFK